MAGRTPTGGSRGGARRLGALRTMVVTCLVTVGLGPVGTLSTGPAQAAARPTTGQLVVKLAPNVTIDAVNRQLGSTTASTLLASRSIYLLDVPIGSTALGSDLAMLIQLDLLALKLTRTTKLVEYAEPNRSADSAEDERFHYWPSGGPQCIGTDPAVFTGQPAATQLGLGAAHRTTKGAGTIVAVLDTGVDASHPQLAGRIAPGGFDYVDDDTVPQDTADGIDTDGDGRVDEGSGHGTFVASLVTLVAPDARILPARVLDSEGRGNVFTVAEAIYDATRAGAKVINMSFGTTGVVESRVLRDAIDHAVGQRVSIVASAGNDASSRIHYPASSKNVLSVAALDTSGQRLASFSAYGALVDVAAPGVDLVAALPCGYGRWSGSSMASPLAAGAAALEAANGRLLSLTPRPTDRIELTARRVWGLKVRTGVLDVPKVVNRGVLGLGLGIG